MTRTINISIGGLAMWPTVLAIIIVAGLKELGLITEWWQTAALYTVGIMALILIAFDSYKSAKESQSQQPNTLLIIQSPTEGASRGELLGRGVYFSDLPEAGTTVVLETDRSTSEVPELVECIVMTVASRIDWEGDGLGYCVKLQPSSGKSEDFLKIRNSLLAHVGGVNDC